ncbi:MAG: hypothetical protein QOH97_1457 [Actinoplanes sp.]|nr:hypothetical protein [Actinoplanes sp.]
MSSDDTSSYVAVIGMAGRFPGAPDVETFWHNIASGVESVAWPTEDELRRAGATEAELADPRYVRAATVLDGLEDFDAGFFGLTAMEATILDPQHRLLLECAQAVFDNAGYDPERLSGVTGVYTGVGFPSYLVHNLLRRPELLDQLGTQRVFFATDKAFAPTRISHRFNLTGPSIGVDTACSTSLVAIHQACQALLAFECDLTIAGGASAVLPHGAGYLYQEGGTASPDGHCRAFDARAAGTRFGSGVGLVLLKRLDDALTDSDGVLAVIRGSAVNNDGSAKAGFTAPSAAGQAAVIAQALAVADVDPDTIGLVEAHGTGTIIGDPIEVAGLTRAFRRSTERRGFCAIGSVKTNVGHLDVAAGVTGLIKVVQALGKRVLPPSLNFENPNPAIDFADGPFFVNTERRAWEPPAGTPRRAGVSSFGIGGTNVHVVIEEAPPPPAPGPSRTDQLLVVSARSPQALDQGCAELVDALKRMDDPALPDVAYTLSTGRRAHPYRRSVVCRDVREAVAALESVAGAPVDAATDPEVVFMFPGQGAQQVGMLAELYDQERVFREPLDRCADHLARTLDVDLRDVIRNGPAERLEDWVIGHPALFSVSFALAQVWQSWGVRPAVVLGHSLGEYVAATVAGVFGVEDALELVVDRARAMTSVSRGAMLAVSMDEASLGEVLGDCSLAAVNSPTQCVAAGPFAAVEELERRLDQRGVEHRRVRASHAAHSSMLDDVAPAFADRVARVRTGDPTIPLASCLTGEVLTAAEARDPGYWSRHMRGTVRFARTVANASAQGRLLLEVGPTSMLSRMVRRIGIAPERIMWSAGGPDSDSDPRELATALGRLCRAGVPVAWDAYWDGERRRRVALPAYPFQRQRHWIEPTPRQVDADIVPPPAATVAGAVGAALPVAAFADEPDADPYERELLTIFGQSFGVASVRLDDSFHELGGDSLLAVQLMSRVRRTFPVELGVKDLFAARTVRNLARSVRASSSAGEVVPVIAAPRTGPLPLSLGQESLWLTEQLRGPGVTYNIPGAVRMTGALDVEALTRSVAEIIARHEILRTTVTAIDGVPVQVVHEDVAVELPPRPIGADEVQDAGLEHANHVFDLAQGPLLAFQLLRVHAHEHVLLVNLHHIVADGYSLSLLVEELVALYSAFVVGAASPLPALPFQYADFVHWQRRWLDSESSRAQLAFWRRTLAGAPRLELPTDRPRGDRADARGAVHRFVVDPDVAVRLGALGRDAGATLFMVLLTGFTVALSRWAGTPDVSVGTTLANRDRAEFERMIGMQVNSVVLRSDVTGNPTFGELLARVRTTSLDAFTHADLPFLRLVDELRPERVPGSTPLFQVLFLLQKLNVTVDLPGVTAETMEIDAPHTKYDLSLFMEESDAGITGTLVYRAELFDAITVELFAARLARILAGAAAAPDAPIDSLSAESDHETRWRAMAESESKTTQLSSLRTAKRRTVDVSQLSPVTTSHLPGLPDLPLVIEPATPDVDLPGWLAADTGAMDDHLHRHGAVLLRGFGGGSVERFEQAAAAICPTLFREYGDLPREGDSAQVYKSTPYPRDQVIAFHNESSHLHEWPMRQFFSCIVVAQQGGETPIVDCRQVYRKLRPELAEQFATRGLRYVRNFIESVDVSWSRFYGTDDRAVVERKCAETGVELAWEDDGTLRTWRQAPAVLTHPRTHETVFFNQLALHHPSCLDPDTRQSLESLYGVEGLPRNVFWGDGEVIDDEIVAEVRELMDRESLAFAWREGDILVIDNMLVAHSRSTFVGPRKIVVALGDMAQMSADAVEIRTP